MGPRYAIIHYLFHHPIDWLLGKKVGSRDLKEVPFCQGTMGVRGSKRLRAVGLAMAARQSLVSKACPTILAWSSQGQPQPQALAPLWWWGCASSLQVALAQWGPCPGRAGLWGAGTRPCCSLTGAGPDSLRADTGLWAITAFGSLWVLMFWYHL